MAEFGFVTLAICGVMVIFSDYSKKDGPAASGSFLKTSKKAPEIMPSSKAVNKIILNQMIASRNIDDVSTFIAFPKKIHVENVLGT
jgi:hypothetical protein